MSKKNLRTSDAKKNEKFHQKENFSEIDQLILSICELSLVTPATTHNDKTRVIHSRITKKAVS